MDNTVIDELQTLADFVRWGASRFNEAGLFFGHGTDNAIDEAVTLVLHLLHLNHDMPEVFWQTQLSYREKSDILKLFQQRLEQRIPTPYLTHQAWFAHLPFYVDSRVLIPRSPIAQLIEAHYEPWVDPAQVERVLDLCCGSGCIGIASALQAFPTAQVDLVDLAADALAVAKRNVETYHLSDRVQLIESDLFDNVAAVQYDLIVSNPPYVDAQEIAQMPPEYHHEPRQGLAAGEDGLLFVRQILLQAKNYLTPHGVLIVEVGASAEALIEAYPNYPFLWLEFAQGGEGVFLLTYDQL